MTSAVVFIPLSRQKVTVVDFDDFELVRSFKWRANESGIKQKRWTASSRSKESNWSHLLIHQQIMGAKGVDHVNGDPLDNRRSNLRLTTAVENARAYRRKGTASTSRFRGVSYFKVRSKWQAQISAPSETGVGVGKRIHLGCFPTEEAAARAYDEAAKRYGYPPEALNFK